MFQEVSMNKVSSIKFQAPKITLIPLVHQIQFVQGNEEVRQGWTEDMRTAFYVRGNFVFHECLQTGTADWFTCFPHPSESFDLFAMVQKYLNFKSNVNNVKYFDVDDVKKRVCPIDGKNCQSLTSSALQDVSYLNDHMLDKHLKRGFVCIKGGVHIYGPIFSISGMKCHLHRDHEVVRKSKQMDESLTQMKDFYNLKL